MHPQTYIQHRASTCCSGAALLVDLLHTAPLTIAHVARDVGFWCRSLEVCFSFVLSCIVQVASRSCGCLDDNERSFASASGEYMHACSRVHLVTILCSECSPRIACRECLILLECLPQEAPASHRYHSLSLLLIAVVFVNTYAPGSLSLDFENAVRAQHFQATAEATISPR